ncbi:MAG: helix-turn-helix transcriptional regulator, partial [Planctomycetaceae bacterium]|nr:helix-turn-helix transcriptional regulator [Planctomycetaceae bacterium]
MLNSSEHNKSVVDPLLWERIYSLCIQRGWNIGRLARESGVSRTTLHNWQQGKTARPHISTIYKLAEVLNIDLKNLLGSDEDSLPITNLPDPRDDWLGQPTPNPADEKSIKQDLFSGQEAPVARSVPDQARLFDRQTNWSIQSVCEQTPDLFAGWTDEEWDELFSSFGTGGELSEQGIRKKRKRSMPG